jgi:hypothetical protein
VARASIKRSLTANPGQVRIRGATGKLQKHSTNFDKLAVTLALDSEVTWLEYVESLRFAEGTAIVGMLVADRADGRVAFDIVDEGPPRDFDTEGLLLIALEYHQIRLVETDSAKINAGPRSRNSLRIWRHRGRPVEHRIVRAIDRTLAGQRSLSVKTLGTLLGLTEPLAIVSALICRRVLDTDLSTTFGLNSLVTRRWDFGATLISKNHSAVWLFGERKP